MVREVIMRDKIVKGKVVFELDKPDINGNIWTKEATEKAIADYKKRFMEKDNNMALGELEHGISSYVNLTRVSHKLTDLRIDKNQLICDVEILNTPMGEIALEMSPYFRIGVRAMGEFKIDEDGNKVIENADVISFDILPEPMNRSGVSTFGRLEKLIEEISTDK